ncbi:hypothetical protein EDE12_1011193 [Methylosinus sp. sav-2]|uniref:hypothetical protein n=1 Tax=Methylosinus sp. sav-2 TaxID=2485168 RepID=UPI00047BB2E1|nr:hypothetical protein [Methylosinus sp. sav-2]TDX67641.1 hypothetical protein EDE12_1011193 [Methylosinus sp. sav-2]
MTTRNFALAFSPDALMGKSRAYIVRALAAKSRGSLGEYQLWASLALELLGKSALAGIHPCLIADPQSSESLFAAAGMTVGTDLKTITAKTVFERLTHISTRFDKKTQVYCQNMSLKRNAELHSGEAPFEAATLSSWEGRYWHTAEIILETKKLTIETWLGADQAKAPKELLAEYTHAIVEAAKVRIETAREAFSQLSKKARDAAFSKADALRPWEFSRSFHLLADSIWETKCPACGSRAFLAGVKYAEEVSEDLDDEHSDEETVDVFFAAEEFQCPSCGLHLDSRDEIEAAGLDIEHTEIETRQREYEPDYGND